MNRLVGAAAVLLFVTLPASVFAQASITGVVKAPPALFSRA
jgi:hypothetical protein